MDVSPPRGYLTLLFFLSVFVICVEFLSAKADLLFMMIQSPTTESTLLQRWTYLVRLVMLPRRVPTHRASPSTNALLVRFSSSPGGPTGGFAAAQRPSPHLPGKARQHPSLTAYFSVRIGPLSDLIPSSQASLELL